MTLQERMIRYRAVHNMSQEEFARKCSLSKQTINAVENGIQEPSKITREKIIIVLEEKQNVEV